MKNKGHFTGIRVLLLACILAACGGPKENCAESHDPRNTRTLRTCTDKKEYGFGAPIYITFTVTNVSDEPLALDGGDRPALDISIRDEYWSDGQELTPDLTRVMLEPGESRTITWVWPTPQTDLDAVQRAFAVSPEAPSISIHVHGIVIPMPGARGGYT